MLFLYGVYGVGANGKVVWFRWVRAPITTELTELTHTIAERVGLFLQRQGLLERDGEQGFPAGEAMDEGTMDPLLDHSMMCREARMPRSAGMRKSGLRFGGLPVSSILNMLRNSGLDAETVEIATIGMDTPADALRVLLEQTSAVKRKLR